MFRIDSAGATNDNKFTEGDPQNAIPATDVSAEWLNDVQENISKAIEAAGITLIKGDFDQLTQAIGAIAVNTSVTKTLLNNQSPAVNLTGVILDKTKYRSVEISYDLKRRDSLNFYWENARMVARVNDANNWELYIAPGVGVEDHGTVFTIDASTGQVKYTTTNMGGSGYLGDINLKFLNFPKVP